MPSPTENDQDGRKDIYSRLRGKSAKPKDPQIASLKENRRAASLSDFGKRSTSAPFRLNSATSSGETGPPKTALPTLSVDVGDTGSQLGEDDGIKGFMTAQGSSKSSGTRNSSYMQPTRSSVYHQRSQKLESSPLAPIFKEEQSSSTRGLEHQLSELRAHYSESESQLKRRIEQMQAEWHQEKETLRNENLQRREELSSLKQKYTKLMQSIGKMSHSTDQLPDDFLRDEMKNWDWEMQNWVANSFRKSHVAVTNLSSSHRAIVEQAVPNFKALQHHKVASLQAIIVWYLKPIFDEKLFYGMPEENVFRHLHEAEEALNDATIHFNRWRTATVKYLLSRSFPSIDKNTEKLVYEMMESIDRILSEMTGSSLTASQKDNLRRLVNHAIDISRLFKSQLAVFQFEFLDLKMTQRAVFNRKTMEDISGDESTGRGGAILVATSPVVRKYGDEKGDNMQLESILLRAKVIKDPEAIAEERFGP